MQKISDFILEWYERELMRAIYYGEKKSAEYIAKEIKKMRKENK